MARTILSPQPSTFPDVMPAGPRDIPGGGYQDIRGATPEAFGGRIGAAEQQAGERVEAGGGALVGAAIQRQDQYNAIVADDQLTKFNNDADKLLYTGDDALFKKRGDDYMRAHDSTLASLQDLRTQYASRLNPDQALRFNSESRNYLTRETRIMGARFDEAQKEYGLNTNAAGADLDKRKIAAAPEDDAVFDQQRESIRSRKIKDLQLLGRANDPDAVADAMAKADSEAWHQRIEALLLTNPAAAERVMHAAPPGTFTGDDINRYTYHIDTAKRQQDEAYNKTYSVAWLAAPEGAKPPYNPPSMRGGAVGGGAAPSQEASQNATQIRDVLKARGWSDAAITGALANGVAESGLQTWGAPGSAGEQGIFQFNPASHLPLFEKAKGGDHSARAQAEYVADWVDEHMPDYKGMTDKQAATDQFMTNFEAPKDAASGSRYQHIATAERALAGGGIGLQADFAKRSGTFGTPEQAAQHLTTVTAPGGATFQVHEKAAPQIQGFVNELAGMGYKIDPAESSGYNNRNKVGVDTNEKSEHAYGTAIDINADRNKQADNLITDLPANISQIAAKWGLKWGGDFEGKKDAMHFEVARLLPGGQPEVQVAQAGGPDVVVGGQPTPPGARPAAEVTPAAATAVATAHPDLERTVNQIYASDLPDNLKSTLISGAQKADSRWRLAHASEMRQLTEDVNNNIAQLNSGADVPLIPEDRIKSYARNPDVADDMIQKQQDAQQLGIAIRSAQTMTLSEAVNKQVELDAATKVPGIHDFAMREKAANNFRRAREFVTKGMSEDPVNYLSGNNDTIIADQEAMRQLRDGANTPEGNAAYAQASQKYATDLLAAQERYGLPNSAWHVLGQTEAQGVAQQITQDPANAPARLQALEKQWGNAWPQVWSDLVTFGKLPAAYQAVGALDNEADAALLASGLSEATKGKVWNDLLGEQYTKETQTAVRGNGDVQKLVQSLSSSGHSATQIAGLLGAIDTLAYAKKLFKGDDNAVPDAIQSFISKYEFMPSGGARVPAAQFDAVSRNAQGWLEALQPAAVAIPQAFQSNVPGAPKPDDYVRSIKAAPTWITSPKADALWLLDHESRIVRLRDGNPVAIPFAQPAPPPGPSPIPPVAIPPS